MHCSMLQCTSEWIPTAPVHCVGSLGQHAVACNTAHVWCHNDVRADAQSHASTGCAGASLEAELSEGEWSDDDLGDIPEDFRDFIYNCVLNPQLAQGFKWSGKNKSHTTLEDNNCNLRRRLAGTLLGLDKNPAPGGLLEIDTIMTSVLDQIHELGQAADDLAHECALAKRGSPDLSRRTEELEFKARSLDSWLDWLRQPTMPGGTDGKSAPLPIPPAGPLPSGKEAAVPPPASTPTSVPAASPAAAGPPAAAPAPKPAASAVTTRQLTARQAAAEKQAAADKAMQALLEGAALLRRSVSQHCLVRLHSSPSS